MAIKAHSTIHEDVLKRWDGAAVATGIPKEAYDMPVKIVGDETGKSDYAFGVIYSPHRKKRPNQSDSQECLMCRMVKEAEKDTRKNLFPGRDIGDFIITINMYPSTYGASLAITRNERPMYNTKEMKTLKDDLGTISKLCIETGYRFFHQTEGAGATIPRHEHWQLVNWENMYTRAGGRYGFDAAETESLSGFDGVKFMPSFPFAHLIFDIHDFEKIEFFLRSLQRKNRALNGLDSTPHSIVQGQRDVLITPFKGISGRKLGAGHTGGHVYVHEEDQFNAADYPFCIEFLKQGLYLKEELNLKNYL